MKLGVGVREGVRVLVTVGVRVGVRVRVARGTTVITFVLIAGTAV